MSILEFLEEYKQLLDVKKVGNIYTFSCPICKSKAITIRNTNLARCSGCNYNFDMLKLKNEVYKLTIYKILEFYKRLNFSLIKIEKGSKEPKEKKWQNAEHRDIEEWKSWLKEGYNIGVNLGLSNLVVIDFDSTEDYIKFKDKFPKTLIQKTNKGYHYFYRGNTKGKNLRPNFNIEIKGNGQQVVVQPSKIEGFTRFFLELVEPIECPDLEKILDLKNKKNFNVKLNFDANEETGEKIVPEGSRHYDLISTGGHFKNLGFSPKQINTILRFINNRYYVKPKPIEEINHICESLYDYKLSEEEEAKKEILDYLSSAHEASKAEIEIALFSKRVTGLKKKVLDRLLVELIKSHKIYKVGRNYVYSVEAKWKSFDGIDNSEPIKFKMPYFYDCCNFVIGDNILISAPTGTGKTTMSINLIKRLTNQGIKPYILQTEPNKRFLKIAKILGLSKESFYYNEEVIDPECLDIVDNSVTIIDWLDPSDWTRTEKIFARLSAQSRIHRAVIIIFMQLRSNATQFAKDLVNSFPSFCVNFILEEDRIHGKFVVVKNNDPIFPYIREIPTIYNPETKILRRADEHNL